MKVHKLSIHLVFIITYISALPACNNGDIKYDKNDRIIEKKVKGEYSNSTEVLTYKYDKNGNKIEENSTWSDHSGHKIIYDSKGREIEVYNKYSAGILLHEKTYKYDELDNKIEEIKYDQIVNIGGVESRTLSKYSEKNKITEEIVYDWQGRLLEYSSYDNNGKIIKHQVYNEKGDLIEETNSDKLSISTETIEYNEDGSIKKKSITTTTYNNPQ